jgi:PAS domain S-box-containing protein
LEVDWHGDGGSHPRVLRVLGEPEHDEQGQLVAMQGALQDVTESRQEQQQLRLLQTAVAQLNDVVLISEVGAAGPAHDRIVFVNAAFERLSGRSAAEVLGQAPAGAGAGPADAADAVREKQLTRADGSLCWVEEEVVALRAADGRVTHHVAVQRDISDRKHAELERQALERQLREAQKIESIGTLAGGIAHDFNNILPAILGNVALAQQDLPADHPAVASLEQIHTAALRARTLVQQILTFSRRQPQALVVQPLQPVIEETLSLLRATLPAAVKLETAITPQVLLVEADATQLQQVVMNLCTNAWQALPEGRGRIEVGLALREAEAATAEGTVPAGPRAHLWVADNGCGMAPEVLERIFDPFFTTKPVGQGTGLGLSVVHGIVRLLRGSVGVNSTPGQGSRFDVLLPLAVDSAPAASTADGPAAAVGGRGVGQRLLYVDDDEVMGLMVQRLLQREGYEVTGLSSPVQALALLRQDPAAFDLVISDFNMPEMSGTELAAQLRQLRPALPVMISSGYISEALREQAAVLGVRALLQKEQTLEALPGLVRQLLAQAG